MRAGILRSSFSVSLEASIVERAFLQLGTIKGTILKLVLLAFFKINTSLTDLDVHSCAKKVNDSDRVLESSSHEWDLNSMTLRREQLSSRVMLFNSYM